MKRIVPIGGLGNRMRCILSARALWGEVEVLWASSTAVHGASYTDVFEGLDGVTFTHAGSGHAHELDPVQWPHDVMTSNPVEDAPEGWTLGYRDVKPRPALQEMINKLKASMGGAYVAIHARRLDHAEHAPTFGHFTTDQELETWVKHRERLPLYVATDDPASLVYFKSWCPHPVVAHRTPERVHGYEIRPGTLADAVVDMFVCAGAVAFKGSWMSSYSETISLLRCGGAPDGGFVPRLHMQSADAEWFRGRPDRAEAALEGNNR
jgi:hypothetical protein